MQKAELTDKNLIVDILVQSFSDNKSINYIVKQDSRREARLRKLMPIPLKSVIGLEKCT